MGTRGRAGRWVLGLTAALVAVVLASASIGPVTLPLEEVTLATLNAIALPTSVGIAVDSLDLWILSVPIPLPDFGYTYLFDFAVPATAESIVRTLRLPRIALAAVVGLALATAVAVMQGFFRNPMADPSIIGVSTG
ncbi:MAG: iron chelate uptake ABC transporter family permease subunit, partial [Haloarculaceae archaeon]